MNKRIFVRNPAPVVGPPQENNPELWGQMSQYLAGQHSGRENHI